MAGIVPSGADGKHTVDNVVEAAMLVQLDTDGEEGGDAESAGGSSMMDTLVSKRKERGPGHASPQAGICRIWSRIPQTLRIDNFVETLSRDDSLRRWGQRPNEEIHSGKCSGRDGDVRNRPCVRRTSLDKLDAQGLDPAHLCQGELVACTGHQLPSCLPC